MNSGLVTISNFFHCNRFDSETFHVFEALCTILQGNCGIELAQECENCEALGFGKAQI